MSTRKNLRVAGSQSVNAITKNQLHDFLINSRHSYEKYFHNCTLWDYNHCTVDPRIKFGLKMGDYVVKKIVIFLRFSSVIMHFFFVY